MSITAISPTPGLSTSSHHQFTLSNRLSLLSLPFSRPNRPISLPGGGNFIARTNVFVHFETKTLLHKPHRLAFTFSTRAADSTQPSAVSASPDKAVVTDDEFSLAKVRLCFFMIYELLIILAMEEMFEMNVVFKLCGSRILFSRVLKIVRVVEIWI